MASLHHPSPASESDIDLAAEVGRLRELLERQPSCLMRVSVQGTLLAVNDTALCLLGARGLADVLGTSLLDRIAGSRNTDAWTEFIRRVGNGGSASVECELQDPGGTQRAVVMQGVVIPVHPDGEDSILLTVRDVSTARRLQASLQTQEELRRSAQQTADDATASVHDLRTRLAAVIVERDRLRAALDAGTDERQQLLAAIQQLKHALETAIDATLLAQQLIAKGASK